MDNDNSKGDEEIPSYPAKICEVIAKYVDNPLELSTFATGGEIDPFTLGIPAVVVKNVGRVAYPLCVEQSESLLKVATQAPFGHGTETVLDVSVRKAWQIDSDLVVINQQWLNNSLPKIVADCCTKLGVDAVKLNVRANLYKMLLYTEGGHFKRHKDTEKEPGMFGSLLIQLPADHEGGSLVVEHDGKSKRFEFAKNSADKAFYSSFYADCDHVLEPVTKGMRLVLAFNLVRGVEVKTVSTIASASDRESFEEALVSATKEWIADDEGVEKFVYPLAFQYTETNISFPGLKGNDQKILRLLQNTVNPETGEKLFSVYLALVTKHVTGTEEESDYYGGRGGGGMSSDCDIDTEYQTDSWVGPDGPVDFGELSVDFSREVITALENGDDEEENCAGIFGEDPDNEESEGYCGNYAGSLEYWYNSAVLVFWPAARDFSIKLSANFNDAKNELQEMDRSTALYAERLTMFLQHLFHTENVQWTLREILPLTLNVGHVKALLVLSCKNVYTEDSCRAVVEAVAQYGLAELSNEFSTILQMQPFRTAVILLQLVEAQALAPLPDNVSADSSTSAATDSGTTATTTPTLTSLVDIVVKKVVASHHTVQWHVSDVLPITRNVEQVKTVLSGSIKQAFTEDDCRAVILAVSQYGLAALSTEFSAVLQSQSLKKTVLLLQLVEAQALVVNMDGSVTSSGSAATAPPSWNEMVLVLVGKVLASPCTDSDADLTSVCDFIVTHCDVHTQLQIANHLNERLKLKSLNHLIKTVVVTANSSEFIAQLKEYAVLQCIRKAQSVIDLTTVLDWVVRGHHNKLIDMLRTMLLELCLSPELFRALFAVPSVVAELKRESHVSAQLESIVQARIDVLSRVIAAHKVSWCMPNARNVTSEPRVGAFLAGPEQQIVIRGIFNSIHAARSWQSYFGNGPNQIPHVSMVPTGTGKNAMVTLTKMKSFMDSMAQTHTNNVNELNNLKRLLKVRSAPQHAQSTSAANTAAVVAGAGTGAAGNPQSGQPGSEQKKQKVEREVIVID